MQVMRHVFSFHLINFGTKLLYICVLQAERHSYPTRTLMPNELAEQYLLYNLVYPYMLDWHSECHL